MTLPLIYVLNNGSSEDKKTLMNIVKNHNEDKVQVKKAIDIVVNSGGIAYAHKKMMEIKSEAIDLIQHLPDNHAKEVLLGLVEYTVTRKK